MRSVLRILVGSMLIGMVTFVMSLLLINAWILRYGHIQPVEGKQYEIGIVLGAAVTPQGELSYAFQERVDGAIAAWETGLIEKIFVSGYEQEYYKEITIATNYLLDNGVPASDIQSDPRGVDTYDSMRRAVHVYDISQAVIFTQQYHLSRSVYIARNLGLKAVGVPVDKDGRWLRSTDNRREFLARMKAFIEIVILNKPPVKYTE